MLAIFKKAYQYCNIKAILFQGILVSRWFGTINYLNFVHLHPEYHKIVIATFKNREEYLYCMLDKIREKNLTTPVENYVGETVRSLHKNKFVTKSIFLQSKSSIVLISCSIRDTKLFWDCNGSQ